MFRFGWVACLALVLIAVQSRRAAGLEHVVLTRDGKPVHVSGKVLVEAEDGGLLLLAPDGELWIIPPEEMQRRKADPEPFRWLDQAALGERLLRQTPGGFRLHETANYVIAYNTSPAYAEWCGSLYERLYRGFFTYWENRGLKLREPEHPLPALVFRDKTSFQDYSRPELGDAVNAMIGYYNMRTNLVIMYDLTGADGLNRRGARLTSSARVNQILSQPAAERTVATIVHEATHQLAYNSGLQTRYGPNPFWVSEGLAVFFESPDLNSSKGWKSIGAVNRYNLLHFRRLLARRSDDSLLTLIRDDARFRDPQRARAAYAEAWALNYFLLRVHPQQYGRYLTTLAALPPLTELDADQRAAQFREVIGDWRELDEDFVRYMRRVR